MHGQGPCARCTGHTHATTAACWIRREAPVATDQVRLASNVVTNERAWGRACRRTGGRSCEYWMERIDRRRRDGVD